MNINWKQLLAEVLRLIAAFLAGGAGAELI